MRRTGWKWLAGAVGILMVTAAVFVLVEAMTAVHLGGLTPSQGAFVPSQNVGVVAVAPNLRQGSTGVRLLVDGQQVPPEQLQVLDGRVQADVKLAEGIHRVDVEYRSSNPFARRLEKVALFQVDTVAPVVDVREPFPSASVPDPTTPFLATFNEPAAAVLLVDGRSILLAKEGNGAIGQLKLKEGKHAIGLRVTDPAGNTTVKEWVATADFTAPRMSLAGWPGGSWDVGTADLTIVGKDNLPDGLKLKATLDGAPVKVTETAGSASKPTKIKRTTGSGSVSVSRRDRVFTAHMENVPEGKHVAVVTLVDAGGHAVGQKQSFLVDSTEQFGERPLAAGARGQDVKDFQKALAAKGFYKGPQTGSFDTKTADGLVAFKNARGISPATRVLDKTTLSRFVKAIKINRADCRLYLIDEGKVVKTYDVAVGQSAYPTPSGSYKIIEKEVDPTWDPPSSPWAAGLGPIPPGPGNPLGTRWMGTSAPAIGIHGTYNDGSIGTHASHGCIRMHIPDVEQLYELVYIGTPVTIE